ncbi:MAG: hypothetical protein ACLR56_09245 [Oscillospiraceae bacterium]
MSSVPVTGMPETAFDMVNRYGTYNIQSTVETENMYPTVNRALIRILSRPIAMKIRMTTRKRSKT